MRHIQPLTAKMALLALAIPLAVLGPASPALAAARSTDVNLVNNSGCALFRTGYNLAHGEWSSEPPSIIAPNQTAHWASESNGIGTGTEGDAEYVTLFCDINYAQVRVYWDNPYIGANSYNYDGTDSRLRAPWDGGGGDNATVTFYLGRV